MIRFKVVCLTVLFALSGAVSFAGDAQPLELLTWFKFRQQTGGSLPEFREYKADFQVYHPADTNRDHVISGEELGLYSAAWQNGETWPANGNQLISIDSVTQAAQIQWDFDGLYFYFSGELTGLDEPSDALSYYDYYIYGVNGSLTVGGVLAVGGVAVSGDTGPTSYDYYIFKPASVTLELNEPDNWTALAIEETLPEDWSAEQYQETWEGNVVDKTSIRDVMREDQDISPAVFSQRDGRTVVRWGPFKPGDLDDDWNFRYAITHPEGLLPSNEQLQGVQSYDGVSRPNTGRDIKSAFEIIYPEFNDYGVEISYSDVPVPNVDLMEDINNDGAIDMLNWVVGGEPEESIEDKAPEYSYYQQGNESWVSCIFWQSLDSEYIDRVFLRSFDLKVWRLVEKESVTVTPRHDLSRGNAMAYEATFPRENDGAEYFKMMYRADFSEERYSTTITGALLVTTGSSNANQLSLGEVTINSPTSSWTVNYWIDEVATIILSVSADRFEMEIPPKTSVQFELLHTEVNHLQLDGPYEWSTNFSGDTFRIDNPSATKTMKIGRDGNTITIGENGEYAYYFIDDQILNWSSSSVSIGGDRVTVGGQTTLNGGATINGGTTGDVLVGGGTVGGGTTVNGNSTTSGNSSTNGNNGLTVNNGATGVTGSTTTSNLTVNSSTMLNGGN